MNAAAAIIHDPLDAEKIRAKIPSCRLAGNIVILPAADSTNDIAWQYADKGGDMIVLAEYQSHGRGRRGRKWYGSPGQSLLCSALFRCRRQYESIGLAAAVAVSQTIETLCGLSPQIKWPNDITIGGKKTAGILIESRKLPAGPAYVVGIGLNVHQDRTFFEDVPLDSPATGIDIETGRFTDRNELAAVLFESLERWLDAAAKNPQPVTDAWLIRNRQIGKRISLESDGKRYAGTCVGIDPAGGLVVQLEHGPRRIFPAALTSIPAEN